MFRCQMCTSPCRRPSELNCGHIHCESCINDNKTEDNIIECQWNGKKNIGPCKVKTDFQDISPLQLVECEGSGPPQPYHPEDKAMEPDLERLAHIMGIDKLLKQKKEDEPEMKRKRRASGDSGDGDESSSGACAAQAERAEPDVLLDLLIQLSEVEEDCKEIRGFYEDKANGRVIVTIDINSTEIVREFITKHFASVPISERFALIEQKCRTSFLINPGAKVTLASFHSLVLENRHPDELRDTSKLATVTCLGEDSNGTFYILTTKHIFNVDQRAVRNSNQASNPSNQACSLSENQDNQSGIQAITQYISSYNSKLRCVSTECQGVLENAKVPNVRGKHFIDIAAMPLSGDLQASLTRRRDEMLFPLNNIYQEPLERRDRLENRVVYKHGAVSGTTCGKITNTFCLVKCMDDSGRQYSGMGFSVESMNDSDPFALPGDSGALIWDKNAVPIGIVAVLGEFERPDGTVIPPTVYGIRLDYCLQMLREKADIDIVQCSVVGSPIPAHKKIPRSRIDIASENTRPIPIAEEVMDTA